MQNPSCPAGQKLLAGMSTLVLLTHCGAESSKRNVRETHTEVRRDSADATPRSSTPSPSTTEPQDGGERQPDDDYIVIIDYEGDEDPTTPEPPVVPPAEEATCYKGDAFICEIEKAITQRTNVVRSGKVALTHHVQLSFVARDWSAKQADDGSISHDGFPSARTQLLKNEFGGVGVRIQAENVAYTYIRSGTTADQIAKQLVDMWANSSGHLRNMLGAYRYLGSGVAKSGSYYYATQLFGNP